MSGVRNIFPNIKMESEKTRVPVGAYEDISIAPFKRGRRVWDRTSLSKEEIDHAVIRAFWEEVLDREMVEKMEF